MKKTEKYKYIGYGCYFIYSVWIGQVTYMINIDVFSWPYFAIVIPSFTAFWLFSHLKYKEVRVFHKDLHDATVARFNEARSQLDALYRRQQFVFENIDKSESQILQENIVLRDKVYELEKKLKIKEGINLN